MMLHTFLCQAMCRDSRIVPGAAATEIELARRLKEFSFKETGYFVCIPSFLFLFKPGGWVIGVCCRYITYIGCVHVSVCRSFITFQLHKLNDSFREH